MMVSDMGWGVKYLFLALLIVYFSTKSQQVSLAMKFTSTGAVIRLFLKYNFCLKHTEVHNSIDMPDIT